MALENIGPREARKRLRFGILAFVVGIIGLAILLTSGANRYWRLFLIVPFSQASLGYFQAKAKT